MKHILSVFIGLMMLLMKINAQDVEFSQFYSNPLYLNPALAGANICPEITFVFRNQWPKISNSYLTYGVAYDQAFDVLHGGLGLQLMRDQQGNGTINFTNLDLIYSYFFNLTRSFSIRAGLQGSYYLHEINYNKMIFPDMISPVSGELSTSGEQGLNNKNIFFPDFSAGIVGYSKNFFIGFASHHLVEKKSDNKTGEFYIFARKYTFHAGANINLNDSYSNKNVIISPNILILKQLEFHQINYGLYIEWNSISIGGWIRQNLGPEVNSVNFLIGYYNPNFKLGYSFDYPFSKIDMQSLGSHEISLQFIFPCFKKKKKFQAISCPKL